VEAGALGERCLGSGRSEPVLALGESCLGRRTQVEKGGDKMRRWLLVVEAVVGVVALVALVAGCEPLEPTGEGTETPVVSEPTVGWEADGFVAAGEYARQTTIGGVSLWWRNDADSLYLAMEATTTGWVAVGLDPENRMMGANFILGMVVDGQTMVWDAYGTTPAGPGHPPDEELGGSSDVQVYAGTEEDGTTLLEVQIPLDSGDEFDKPLAPGNSYPVIAAYGRSDSFAASHVSRAQGEIDLAVSP
jgi:hypothetical protein